MKKWILLILCFFWVIPRLPASGEAKITDLLLRNQFAGMPQYDLFLTAGTGHFSMLEEPDWLAEKIKSFLEIR